MGEGDISAFDHHSGSGNIYAVLSEGEPWWGEVYPSDVLRKYDDLFLNYESSVTLPGFLVPVGTGANVFRSRAYFGFFNAAGDAYYAVVRAEPESNLQNPWAVVTVPVQ